MKVLFFAHFRELLGSDSVILPEDRCPKNVAELRHCLQELVPEALASALADENVFCAVNQQVVNDDYILGMNDEIAFFPPMTGG